MEDRFCKPRSKKAVNPTRFLFVVGIGWELGSNLDKLRQFFEKFGPLDDTSGEPIIMVQKRRYVYVCYISHHSAMSAMDYIASSTTNCLEDNLTEPPGVSKVSASYAIEKSTLPLTTTEMECTSSDRNQSVHVSGCHVIPEFITAEEETALLAELDGPTTRWKDTLNRRVQVPNNERTLA
jgi:hypothetical protein